MGAFDALAGRNPILPSDFSTEVKEGRWLEREWTQLQKMREGRRLCVTFFCLLTTHVGNHSDRKWNCIDIRDKGVLAACVAISDHIVCVVWRVCRCRSVYAWLHLFSGFFSVCLCLYVWLPVVYIWQLSPASVFMCPHRWSHNLSLSVSREPVWK